MPSSAAGHFQAGTLGNIRVQLVFNKALDKNINCIVVGQFQSLIDSHRNVTLDTFTFRYRLRFILKETDTMFFFVLPKD
jgi:hypothetical protein